MIDFKKIKDSEYMPSGIRKMQDGGLFIDVDKIKSFFPDINCVRIEYFDGTRITWQPILEEDNMDNLEEELNTLNEAFEKENEVNIGAYLKLIESREGKI